MYIQDLHKLASLRLLQTWHCTWVWRHWRHKCDVCVCEHLFQRYPTKLLRPTSTWSSTSSLPHPTPNFILHRSNGLALCEVLWALDFHTSVDQVYTAGSEVPTAAGRPAVALISPHHLFCFAERPTSLNYVFRRPLCAPPFCCPTPQRINYLIN